MNSPLKGNDGLVAKLRIGAEFAMKHPLETAIRCHTAADRIEQLSDLREALDFACAALREVGDDYPGSSCQLWCHSKATEAEEMANIQKEPSR